MTKQELLEYGEGLAARQGTFYLSPSMGAGVTCGFTAAIELLWPLVEVIEEIDRTDHDCGIDTGLALQALTDLEKKIEGQ